jgi:hypothetical protein
MNVIYIIYEKGGCEMGCEMGLIGCEMGWMGCEMGLLGCEMGLLEGEVGSSRTTGVTGGVVGGGRIEF